MLMRAHAFTKIKLIFFMIGKVYTSSLMIKGQEHIFSEWAAFKALS